MLVSVAICTWNRSALLDQTLARMRELHIPDGHDWEVLVVNNNCTDDTDAVIAKYGDHLPVRRLLEMQQGHSNARNCAASNARGELILWTDDDVLVDRDWLAAYVRAVEEHPNAGYFGGPVEPWFESEPPRWVKRNLDSLQGPFALCALGPVTRPFVGLEAPFGANMAFRMEHLRGKEFDRRLGRVGAGMLSGDETTVFDRLRDEGRLGIWVGNARVRHYIPMARMTPDYIWKFFHGLGRTRQRIRPYNRGVPLFGTGPRWIWRRYLFACIKALLSAPVNRRSWLENYIDAAVHRGILDECRSGELLTTSPTRRVSEGAR